MTAVFQITQADFAAAKVAFSAGDYQQFHLLANRLMANTVYGRESDRKYAIVGFFLKEIFTRLSRHEKESPTAEKIRFEAEKLIKELERAFTEELDIPSLWKNYHQFVDSTRKVEQWHSEQQSYKDDPQFTANAIAYLVQTALAKETVNDERTSVFQAIRNETDRIIRTHGIELLDLITVCHLTALHRLFEYVAFACSSSTRGVDVSRIDDWVGHYIDNVKQFQKTASADEENVYVRGSDILCALIYEWRVCFIKYFEIVRSARVEERKIELPENTKKQIGETLYQALEKDLQSTGKKPNG
ncbi:hypothetical protein MYX84_02135 [Acidobacteria bacterium AH-259-O06]|nr:hypothetical protein [Acidobacteria bacterium AH-259-O06]